MLRRASVIGMGVGIGGLFAAWLMMACGGGTETIVQTVVVEREVMVDREIAVPETVVVEVERLVVETVVVEKVVERPVVETVVVEKQVVVETVKEIEVPVTVEVIKEVDASGSPVREVTVVVEKEVEVPVTVIVENEVVKEVEVVVEKEVTKIVEVVAPTPTATPLPELGVVRNANISAGGYSGHVCALRRNGGVVCWGANGHRQSEAPRGAFKEISVGGLHTCALGVNGNVVCWGHNQHEQSSAPPGRYTRISAGLWHTCALKENGDAVCWGHNQWGATDVPDLGFAHVPEGPFKEISAGRIHSCGLMKNGDVICWGFDGNGRANSVQGEGFVAISAGGSHTCALRQDGTGMCWGGGTTTGDAIEVDGPFVGISAGEGHTCGLRENGEVTCWGQGNYGQSVAPVGVFTEISAGSTNSCGIHLNGEIACWGGDFNGESTPPGGGNFGGGNTGNLPLRGAFDAASVLARFSTDDAFVGETRAAAAGEILGLYRSGRAETGRVLELLHVMLPELSIEERRRAYGELSRLKVDGDWDASDTAAAVDQLAALITGDELNAGGRVVAAKELVARYESGDLSADRALDLMDTIAPGLSINQRRQAAVTLARLSADRDWDDGDRMVAANEVFRLVTGVPLDFERRADAAVDLAGVGVTIFGNGGEISDSQVSAATTVIKQGLAGNLTSETVQGILGFGN